MGYYSDDVYYNPEKFGLTTVGEIEWDNESYSFNLTAVFRNEQGEYFMASDSGCSCPSPFESFTSVEMLDGPYDKEAVKFHLREGIKTHGKTDTYYYGRTATELRKDVNALIRRLK